MAKRKTFDWEAIEAGYRSGVPSSIRLLAKEHGCSEGAIRKRAKRDKWERDLTQKVQEKVRTELVRTEVRTAEGQIKDRATEHEIIEAAARKGVEVVRFHRKGIKRSLEAVEKLTDQLHSTIDEQEPPENAVEGVEEPEELKKLREMYRKASSLPKCASVMVSLSIAWKNFVTLERQAFNLDTKDGTEDKNTMIIHDPTRPDMDL